MRLGGHGVLVLALAGIDDWRVPGISALLRGVAHGVSPPAFLRGPVLEPTRLHYAPRKRGLRCPGEGMEGTALLSWQRRGLWAAASGGHPPLPWAGSLMQRRCETQSWLPDRGSGGRGGGRGARLAFREKQRER